MQMKLKLCTDGELDLLQPILLICGDLWWLQYLLQQQRKELEEVIYRAEWVS